MIKRDAIEEKDKETENQMTVMKRKLTTLLKNVNGCGRRNTYKIEYKNIFFY